MEGKGWHREWVDGISWNEMRSLAAAEDSAHEVVEDHPGALLPHLFLQLVHLLVVF